MGRGRLSLAGLLVLTTGALAASAGVSQAAAPRSPLPSEPALASPAFSNTTHLVLGFGPKRPRDVITVLRRTAPHGRNQLHIPRDAQTVDA